MIFSKILVLSFIILALAGVSAYAQKIPDTSEISKAIEKDGCTITDEGKVKICKFDYKYKGKNVEALIFKPPVEDGKYPGVLLIPGYSGTPQTEINLGRIFVKRGFAAMAVGTPGFGKTELVRDGSGKNTINAFIAGYKKFKKESFVNSDKMGIFGYSRGAIAASLMITRLKDVKATVLGGGVYDLEKAYNESIQEGIKESIKETTGLTKKAFRERSVIFKVKKIKSPVLIIHSEKDFIAPTNQAYLLRDKLKEAGKEFEFHILADHKHGFLDRNFLKITFEFFSRKLKVESTEAKAENL